MRRLPAAAACWTASRALISSTSRLAIAAAVARSSTDTPSGTDAVGNGVGVAAAPGSQPGTGNCNGGSLVSGSEESGTELSGVLVLVDVDVGRTHSVDDGAPPGC